MTGLLLGVIGNLKILGRNCHVNFYSKLTIGNLGISST